MTDANRARGAQLAVALGLIGGVQMLYVSPARESAREAEAEAASLSAQAITMGDPTAYAEDLAERERTVVARFQEIQENNAHADPAQLVGLVQRLGDVSGVRVDRTDPEAFENTGNTRGTNQSAVPPTSGVVVTVEATGTYTEVAQFVANIENRPGYTRTEEFVLRPSIIPGRDEVSVTLRTAQLAFDPDAFQPSTPIDGSTPQ